MAFGTPVSRYASASTSTTAASGKSSGSISTTSGSLVVVAASMHGVTPVTALTLTDTAGWTWVKIYGDVGLSAGIAAGEAAVWVAISNGSANTITVSPDQDSLRETMSVTEFPADNGMLIPSTTPNNTGTNTGTNPTEPSVTLTTTPPSHGQVGVVFSGNGDAMTPGTGFTELVDLQTAAGNDCAQQVQYDLTAPSDGVSDWTGITGESWVAFTMEIQEDSGGGATNHGRGLIGGGLVGHGLIGAGLVQARKAVDRVGDFWAPSKKIYRTRTIVPVGIQLQGA